MLMAAGGFTAQLLCRSSDGWDMRIQTMKLPAAAPMHLLRAEIYEYIFALLAAGSY